MISRTRNRQLEDAVFNIKADKFRDLLDKGALDPSLLLAIPSSDGIRYGYDRCTFFPLYWITVCWEPILEDLLSDDNQYQEIIRQRIIDNQEIKRLFETILKQGELVPIDFKTCGIDYWWDNYDDITSPSEYRDELLMDYSYIAYQCLIMAWEDQDVEVNYCRLGELVRAAATLETIHSLHASFSSH